MVNNGRERQEGCLTIKVGTHVHTPHTHAHIPHTTVHHRDHFNGRFTNYGSNLSLQAIKIQTLM